MQTFIAKDQEQTALWKSFENVTNEELKATDIELLAELDGALGEMFKDGTISWGRIAMVMLISL